MLLKYAEQQFIYKNKKNGGHPLDLESNTEVIGTLIGVKPLHNNLLRCTFFIQMQIELPTTAIPRAKLKQFIGRQIAIINCDNQYAIRLENQNKKYDKNNTSNTP
jgi:hypothetical protein